MSRDEAQAQALKQVEFYFADANLPFDKFLFTLTRKDPEGWVPIETLASFKRMRPIKACWAWTASPRRCVPRRSCSR